MNDRIRYIKKGLYKVSTYHFIKFATSYDKQF